MIIRLVGRTLTRLQRIQRDREHDGPGATRLAQGGAVTVVGLDERLRIRRDRWPSEVGFEVSRQWMRSAAIKGILVAGRLWKSSSTTPVGIGRATTKMTCSICDVLSHTASVTSLKRRKQSRTPTARAISRSRIGDTTP